MDDCFRFVVSTLYASALSGPAAFAAVAHDDDSIKIVHVHVHRTASAHGNANVMDDQATFLMPYHSVANGAFSLRTASFTDNGPASG